ncbi:hypothetical protein EP51_14385 [Rhodococcus opacus]|uniref:Uncharacterized protein n=1 Tax=Rhodococcus opacus TaxID=37919 RepID=A0A076EJ72_RHOOP|nr:hypothetical protein EP51_14385 [Rhodococcus opacus]
MPEPGTDAAATLTEPPPGAAPFWHDELRLLYVSGTTEFDRGGRTSIDADASGMETPSVDLAPRVHSSLARRRILGHRESCGVAVSVRDTL